MELLNFYLVFLKIVLACGAGKPGLLNPCFNSFRSLLQSTCLEAPASLHLDSVSGNKKETWMMQKLWPESLRKRFFKIDTCGAFAPSGTISKGFVPYCGSITQK